MNLLDGPFAVLGPDALSVLLPSSPGASGEVPDAEAQTLLDADGNAVLDADGNEIKVL